MKELWKISFTKPDILDNLEKLKNQFEEASEDIRLRFEDKVTPELYLKEAKCWVSNGAQIVGGCCGVGPELIESLSELSDVITL